MELDRRPFRGIYGGIDTSVDLSALGVDGWFCGTSALRADSVAWLRDQGVKVFGEFNSMHASTFLADHPDAAPIGPEGCVSPPPGGWQGVCPTHPDYRRWRMAEFEECLAAFALDGMWLDYHHAHADWERPDPILPDTCFCARCLRLFHEASGIEAPPFEILRNHKEPWVEWRCGVFTDWVREYKVVLRTVRKDALLGSFHAPWPLAEQGGAVRSKLAVDLASQSRYLDVLSPMPYHAQYGRSVGWIGRSVKAVSQELPAHGTPVWPIVQLSDWGRPVPPEEVEPVVRGGASSPAQGVLAFKWDSLKGQQDKVAALGRVFNAL